MMSEGFWWSALVGVLLFACMASVTTFFVGILIGKWQPRFMSGRVLTGFKLALLTGLFFVGKMTLYGLFGFWAARVDRQSLIGFFSGLMIGLSGFVLGVIMLWALVFRSKKH